MNMYFNVFIYKMFHASPADISAMVMASAVAATVTTLIMGALSDKLGKRKVFMAGGISSCTSSAPPSRCSWVLCS